MNKVKKEYITTKKECQTKIDELGNVCDRCGRKIIPIETVDNSNRPTYWAGCFHGQRSKSAWGHFTHGVPKNIYKLACKIILEDTIYLSMEKEKGRDFEYLFQNGVSKICGIIREIERMKTVEPRYTKIQLREDFNKFYK